MAREYNLAMELFNVYQRSDAANYAKSMGHIDSGKGHYSKLDDITRLGRTIREANMDHPATIDFSSKPEAWALLETAHGHGVITLTDGERQTRTLSQRRVEVITSNLDSEQKVLPHKAEVDFNFAARMQDLILQITKIVSKTLENLTRFVDSIIRKPL